MNLITLLRRTKLHANIPINLILERFHEKPKVLSFTETINYIIESECSVSRFSDGEMGIIDQNHSPGFQKLDKKMAEQLKAALKNTNQEDLLICVPYVFDSSNLNFRTDESKKWWIKYLLFNRNQWYQKLDFSYTYGAANFTRLYMADREKDSKKMNNYFNSIKSIWDSKNLLIIEGDGTKMGVGNDLFRNSGKIKRIIAPSKNAFSKYDLIINAAIDFLKDNEDYLCLLALGPTASIMSQDICRHGFRAIDIGHIDTEYEWFTRNYSDKEAIPGKYVNESNNGQLYFEIKNSDYEKQILSRVGDSF